MTRSSRGQAMERVMFYIELKKLVSSVAVGMALAISLALLGCNSSEAPDEKSGDATIPSKRGTPVTQKSTAPDVDLNCVIDHLQNPPESFHYTFKDESDNPWSEEADVTPQMIDASFKSNDTPAPVPLHGAPTETPHQHRWAIGRLGSRFALVHSIAANQGTETVNGYSTTKLSIDTT